MLVVTEQAETYDLITLAEAKTALGIVGSDQDAELADWISQSSAAISRHCGRVFAVEGLAETFRPGHGTVGLVLSRYPVTEITSIVEDGQTLSTSDYELDAIAGVVSRLWSDRYACWSCCKTVVAYSAGFEDSPDDLKRAVIICLQHMQSASTRDPYLRSEQTTDIEVLSYFNPTTSALPAEALALVETYRAPRIG